MSKTDNELPWSFKVAVAQIPDGGLHQNLDASASERGRLAEIGGLRDVGEAKAAFDLKAISGERVHVTGRVTARVGQTCVITLDPIENTIDEPVDIIFAPASQIPVTPKVVTREEGEDAEIPDPPEPIVNGTIDIGRLATEVLMLGIDPYPRKLGAVFDPPKEPVDPDEHPFAALRALKPAPAGTGGKKPKGN